MAGPPNAENIVATGPKGTVEYAVRTNGNAEAKAWLSSQSTKVRASFGVLFERLVNSGSQFSNKTQFRKLQGMDDVWEFKRGGNRLFCFQHGRRWLLTHPYKKGHSNKHQTSSGKHAITVANEHLDRERLAIKKDGK